MNFEIFAFTIDRHVAIPGFQCCYSKKMWKGFTLKFTLQITVVLLEEL